MIQRNNLPTTQWQDELEIAVNESIDDTKLLQFVYTDGKGTQSIRTVEPTEIRGDKFFAWCHDRDAIRVFKFDSVDAYQVTEDSFEPREF